MMPDRIASRGICGRILRPVWLPRADVVVDAGGAGAAADQDTSLAGLRARRAPLRRRPDLDAQAADEGGGGGGGRGGGNGALDVLPGTYTVGLNVGGQTLTKTVQVELDPRSDMTGPTRRAI